MFDNNDNAVLSTESGVTRNVVSAVDKHSITSPPPCLPWSCADSDSWCCWYFSAIASVLLSCLCISYDIMPPYITPQTTVTRRRHWKILRCLREHTPFPMLDPHPSPPSMRESPVSAAGKFRLNFFPLPVRTEETEETSPSPHTPSISTQKTQATC